MTTSSRTTRPYTGPIADHLLRPDEVARYLSISRNRVYQLMRTRGFPAIRIGKHWRVEPGLLREWVDRQAPGGEVWPE